jgi:hypothetical protein
MKRKHFITMQKLKKTYTREILLKRGIQNPLERTKWQKMNKKMPKM